MYTTLPPEAVTIDPEMFRPLWQQILLGFLIAVVILMTVGGNLLVIIAVPTQRRLRQLSTNFFILNLAVGDFLLGFLVLPFSAVNTLHWEWPFGPEFCNVFIATDVALCTVSILSLFAISLDRYFAVTSPFEYQRRMKSMIVWQACAAIWLFSLVLAFVPIHLGWNTNDGTVQNYKNPRICTFELNKVFVLVDSIGTYFAPLIVMCAVYVKVLLVTRDSVREINKLQKAGMARGMVSGEEKQKHSNLASDTKATITLSTVVLAFAVCWIPYFTLFTVKPFISEPINMHVDLFTLWLGYINSVINPFLYAYYNTTFRTAFANILGAAFGPCTRYYRRAKENKAKRGYLAPKFKTTKMNDNTDNGTAAEMSQFNGRQSVCS